MGQKSKLLVDLRHFSDVRILKLSKRLVRAIIIYSIDFIMLSSAKLFFIQLIERFEIDLSRFGGWPCSLWGTGGLTGLVGIRDFGWGSWCACNNRVLDIVIRKRSWAHSQRSRRTGSTAMNLSCNQVDWIWLRTYFGSNNPSNKTYCWANEALNLSGWNFRGQDTYRY